MSRCAAKEQEIGAGFREGGPRHGACSGESSMSSADFMNQIEEAPNYYRSLVPRLFQAFGLILVIFGFCFTFAEVVNLAFDEGWGMTWFSIPVGIAVALLGLALASLAQRIWDIVYYFASL